MNDIRAYRSYSGKQDLKTNLQLVWSYLHDCHYKEDWRSCPDSKILFTVSSLRSITLSSFKELDHILQQHPTPEKLFLHTHWKTSGQNIRFMLTIEPLILVVSVQSDDLNVVSGIHERVKSVFETSSETSERSPDPRRTGCRKSVFLAHRFDKNGRTESNKLQTFLHRLGFAVNEGEGYQAGTIPDKVAARIDTQDIFLCLVTLGDPSWLQTEAGYARGKDKYIILLVQDEVTFNKGIIGADYEHIQFPKGNVEKSFSDLLCALPT